mmetsp:Transcript_16580/g.20270  ORF Transcript_16580/g.20270 Transcript_16580/m.20270 type:complete len:296 (-) Transcript_16580:22-909(-)
MGSVAKRLGQISARSLESESSTILRTIKSNKIPNSLSQRLDTTLKDSHDMKVFGLGTLSSLSSKERYSRFTHSMYGIYSTMEQELDLSSTSSSLSSLSSSSSSTHSSLSAPVHHFWCRHENILRRSDKLKQDLVDVGFDMNSAEYSDATVGYINALQVAGENDRKTGGGLLLGHAYTRYLADLMGGQVLATPTRLALGLKDGSPKQYHFDLAADADGEALDRKGYVEKIYRDLNVSGDMLTDEAGSDNNATLLEGFVEEARSAFKHNIHVYSEEPIWLDSVVGLKNIAAGWVLRR